MEKIILYIFMAIGLSVDAFSLAVIYGMNQIGKKKTIVLSILVGLFHFFMPYIGSLIGTNLLTIFVDKANFIAGSVFLIIALEMLSSLKEEEKIISLSKWYHLLFFAFTVSLDSFSVGIVLSLNHENIPLAGLIFSIISAIFTYLGLKLGRLVSKKYSNKATIVGAWILIILSLKYFMAT